MALIICPDCGHKISQYAETCNQCGFPLQNFLKDHKLTNIEKTLVCTKCGDYESSFDFNPNTPKHLVCEFCGTPYTQTNLTGSEYTSLNLKEFRKGNEDFEADIAKQYGHGEFDQEAYNRRKEIIAQRVKEREVAKGLTQSSHTPKCPTCGSTNIQKISVTKKAAGAIGFGLFSKTAKSQFECKNCGYKW